MLTSTDVAAKRFRVALRGYSEEEVDAFLERIAKALWEYQAGRKGELSALDVRQQVFHVALRGYNEKGVDQFLDEVERTLRQYERQAIEPATPPFSAPTFAKEGPGPPAADPKEDTSGGVEPATMQPPPMSNAPVGHVVIVCWNCKTVVSVPHSRIVDATCSSCGAGLEPHGRQVPFSAFLEEQRRLRGSSDAGPLTDAEAEYLTRELSADSSARRAIERIQREHVPPAQPPDEPPVPEPEDAPAPSLGEGFDITPSGSSSITETATRLIVTRSGEQGARPYTVLLDDKPIGKLAPGATERFEIPIGMHWVTVKTRKDQSNNVVIEPDQGDQISLQCGPAAGEMDDLGRRLDGIILEISG